MSASKYRTIPILFIFALVFLPGCQTLNLLSNLGSTPSQPDAENAPLEQDAPVAEFPFEVFDTPRCAVGDESASIVSGRIFEGGAPAVGAKVDASSQPGGNPISDEPAQADENGDYQIQFVCNNAACNGSYWVWTVNDEYEQTSPFVQFNFDQNCRRGTLNFIAP